MIRSIIFLITLFFLFFLLFQNKDLVISIQYFPGGSTNPIPLYLIILGIFLFGFIFSLVMVIPGWIRLKLETRKLKKEVQSLAEEVGHLRTAASSTLTPPSSSPTRPEIQGPL
ncbi:MAG: LapA family protein [Nitrospiria bacterium]